MNRYLRERDSINKWFRHPKYRVWKYLMFVLAACITLLLMATIFLKDSLPWQGLVLMRGCAGVLAILFVAIGGVGYYIGYKEYIQGRFNRRGK